MSKIKKITICALSGCAVGIGISIWLLFPYDILAPTVDAGFMRLGALVPPLMCGAIGGLIVTS